jgi:hypothetical protein
MASAAFVDDLEEAPRRSEELRGIFRLRHDESEEAAPVLEAALLKRLERQPCRRRRGDELGS